MIKKTQITGEGYYAPGDDISFVGLTVDEEQALFKEWQTKQNYKARDEIIARHLLFTANLAVKCAPGWLEKDVAISAGNVALMKAIGRFKRAHGARFSVFLRKFVRGEVVAECRRKNAVKFPQGRVTEPSVQLDSLDPKMIVPDYDTTEDHPVEAEDHQARQLEKLRCALRRSWVTDVERHVITEHHFGGKDYQTIADEMPKALAKRGLSRQRIGQIHKRVCKKLRTLMEQYGAGEA